MLEGDANKCHSNLAHLKINPFIPNEISHPYQSDKSIFVLRVAGTFPFYSNVNRTFCKQIVESLIGRSILRLLICFSTVYKCPIKRTLGLSWVTFKIGCSCFTFSIRFTRIHQIFKNVQGNIIMCFLNMAIDSINFVKHYPNYIVVGRTKSRKLTRK